MAVTYHVALPFKPGEDGELVAGEPQEVRSTSAAIFRAKALAVSEGGAVAFSRTGDPDLGEFEDAVIHGRYGKVPDDLGGHVGG